MPSGFGARSAPGASGCFHRGALWLFHIFTFSGTEWFFLNWSFQGEHRQGSGSSLSTHPGDTGNVASGVWQRENKSQLVSSAFSWLCRNEELRGGCDNARLGFTHLSAAGAGHGEFFFTHHRPGSSPRSYRESSRDGHKRHRDLGAPGHQGVLSCILLLLSLPVLNKKTLKSCFKKKKCTCTVPDPTFLLTFSPTEARLQVCVAMEQLPFPCPDTTGPSALRPRQLPGLLLPSPPPGESLRSCLACAVLRHGTERAP